jgi:hypothetical protein
MRAHKSAFVKTLARPLQLPCWLAVAQRPFEPLRIDRIALHQRDFNDGDRARQTSLKAVDDHFLDNQREDAEDAVNIFTDRLAFDLRLDH